MTSSLVGSPPCVAMFLWTQPSALATSRVRAPMSTVGSRRWLMDTKTNPASMKAFGLRATMVLSPVCQPPP